MDERIFSGQLKWQVNYENWFDRFKNSLIIARECAHQFQRYCRWGAFEHNSGDSQDRADAGTRDHPWLSHDDFAASRWKNRAWFHNRRGIFRNALRSLPICSNRAGSGALRDNHLRRKRSYFRVLLWQLWFIAEILWKYIRKFLDSMTVYLVTDTPLKDVSIPLSSNGWYHKNGMSGSRLELSSLFTSCRKRKAIRRIRKH